MEYITRQKIYDSRYWKEECFGLAAVDVLEKAAKIQTIGGLPSKFLCLTLKLLQLQPDAEDIIESFIQQDDFKYVRALGALYLRMTGRPDDIYSELEPLYRDFRKLRCRRYQDWTLLYMDEFIHQLLTETQVLGITLPRLPARATLQEAGYMDDGPRPTALREVLEDAGGPLEFLKQKAFQQNSQAALDLYEKRQGITTKDKKKKDKETTSTSTKRDEPDDKPTTKSSDDERQDDKKRKHSSKRKKEEGEVNDDDEKSSKKKKKKKDRSYGSLVKDSRKKSKSKSSEADDIPAPAAPPPDENSEEYWNEQRAKLGLKALK
eukprot:Sro312_g114590.1 splicing factor 38A (320) ;mRNA; r:34134-35093